MKWVADVLIGSSAGIVVAFTICRLAYVRAVRSAEKAQAEAKKQMLKALSDVYRSGVAETFAALKTNLGDKKLSDIGIQFHPSVPGAGSAGSLDSKV